MQQKKLIPILHFSLRRYRSVPVLQISTTPGIKDMGEGAINHGLPVDPVPHRNGNDRLEDIL